MTGKRESSDIPVKDQNSNRSKRNHRTPSVVTTRELHPIPDFSSEPQHVRALGHLPSVMAHTSSPRRLQKSKDEGEGEEWGGERRAEEAGVGEE